MNRLFSLLAFVALLTAVVPASSPVLAQAGSPDYGASVFLLGNPETTARDIALVKKAELNWIKMAVPWRSIEPSCKNCIDWDDLDRVVLAASPGRAEDPGARRSPAGLGARRRRSQRPAGRQLRLRGLRLGDGEAVPRGLAERDDPGDRGLERAEPGPRVGRRADQSTSPGVAVRAHAEGAYEAVKAERPDQDRRQRRPLADRHGATARPSRTTCTWAGCTRTAWRAYSDASASTAPASRLAGRRPRGRVEPGLRRATTRSPTSAGSRTSGRSWC